MHTAAAVARWTAARAAALDAAGRPLPGAPNIAKLWAGEIARRSAAVALAALGGRGTLHAYDGPPPDDDEAADPGDGDGARRAGRVARRRRRSRPAGPVWGAGARLAEVADGLTRGSATGLSKSS